MKRSKVVKNVLQITVCLGAVCLLNAPQLTLEQKVHDFQNLAAIYNKRYAPYEWKKELLGFDVLEIGPREELTDLAKLVVNEQKRERIPRV